MAQTATSSLRAMATTTVFLCFLRSSGLAQRWTHSGDASGPALVGRFAQPGPQAGIVGQSALVGEALEIADLSYQQNRRVPADSRNGSQPGHARVFFPALPQLLFLFLNLRAECVDQL